MRKRKKKDEDESLLGSLGSQSNWWIGEDDGFSSGLLLPPRNKLPAVFFSLWERKKGREGLKEELVLVISRMIN